jgi:hypothetical protein
MHACRVSVETNQPRLTLRLTPPTGILQANLVGAAEAPPCRVGRLFGWCRWCCLIIRVYVVFGFIIDIVVVSHRRVSLSRVSRRLSHFLSACLLPLSVTTFKKLLLHQGRATFSKI